MKILALSDVEIPAVYNTKIRERFGNVDLVIACGDLPYYYLEYAISMLDIRMYYVQGNHVTKIIDASGEVRSEPWGATNLHRRVVYDKERDLILAGIEGSLRYNQGDHQYTQLQMWIWVLQLTPRLILNKLRYGRYLDIFISHSSPAGIQDESDRAHRGVQAFRWLIKTFQPALFLHGHIHLYNPLIPREVKFMNTRVINAYGYREIEFAVPKKGSR